MVIFRAPSDTKDKPKRDIPDRIKLNNANQGYLYVMDVLNQADPVNQNKSNKSKHRSSP